MKGSHLFNKVQDKMEGVTRTMYIIQFRVTRTGDFPLSKLSGQLQVDGWARRPVTRPCAGTYTCMLLNAQTSGTDRYCTNLSSLYKQRLSVQLRPASSNVSMIQGEGKETENATQDGTRGWANCSILYF